MYQPTMLLFLCVAAAAAVASTNAAVPKRVISMDQEDVKTFVWLMKPGERVNKPVRLTQFVYKNCGDPKQDLANISSITLGPDPVVFPGDISVGFDVTIFRTLDAPLQGEITISKKIGSSWIKIPCIGSIGSCTYDDVCDLLKNAVCPPAFDKNHVPCKCPFAKGSYKLPPSKFTVEVPVFPSGDYRATGKLTYSGKPVACVDLLVTFG